MAIKNRSCVWAVWLLLALPMIFFSGCMSGKVEYAPLSQDGRVLAFTDHTFWSTDVYVADGHDVRRVGAGDGGVFLSQAGDRAVWFAHSLFSSDYTMAIYYPRAHRKVEVVLPVAQSRESFVDSVLFGAPDAVLVGLAATNVLPTAPTPLSEDGEPQPSQPEPKKTYLQWSAKAGWSETSDAKGFAPAASEVSPFVGNTGPRQVSEVVALLPESMPSDAQEKKPVPPDKEEPMSPLVAFGPDGWNATRTVWVTPDGSVVEVSRRNDIPGTVAGFVVFLYPILPTIIYYRNYLWIPAEVVRELTPIDNSLSQRRVDQLVKERTGTKPQK